MAISMWKRGDEIVEINEVPAGEFVAWNTTLWTVTAMNLGGVDLIDANGGSLGRFLYFSGRDLNFHTKGTAGVRVLVRSSGPSLLWPRFCGFARDGTTSAL
jgi:hypothetical protein